MKVSELFNTDAAKSKSADDYDLGTVPFVTNTTLNNGVTKYVMPFADDKQFNGPAICISGLGHATVQHGAFVPKGNGGDSATILTPIETLSTEALLYYAALFNTLHRWRFSFGRKASKRRVRDLDLSPLYAEAPIDPDGILSTFSAAIQERVAGYESQFLSE